VIERPLRIFAGGESLKGEFVGHLRAQVRLDEIDQPTTTAGSDSKPEPLLVAIYAGFKTELFP
jgi:hypothetical protein